MLVAPMNGPAPSSIRRVALVGPVYPWRGGIAQYTMLLDQALVALGLEVQLISFTRLYPRFLYPGDTPLTDGPRPWETSSPCFGLDSVQPLSWLTVMLRLRRWRPDALILQWWTPALAPLLRGLCLLNAWFLQCPVYIICHNVHAHEPAWYDRLVARQVLRAGHRFLVQNFEEKAALQDILQSRWPDQALVIRDHPPYRYPHTPGVSRTTARQHLDLPVTGPMILFCGIVRPYKGLDNLIAALPAVRARYPDAFLAVVGEFWIPRQDVERQIAQLDLQDAVLVQDRYVSDQELAYYLQAASVLCAPYRHNTGSGVLAAAYGFPLALVRTGSPDQARPDIGLFVARPDDPSDLATQLLQALASGADHRRDQDMTQQWQALARDLLGPGLDGVAQGPNATPS